MNGSIIIHYGLLKDVLVLFLALAIFWTVGKIYSINLNKAARSISIFIGMSILCLQLVVYGWLKLPWNPLLLLAPHLFYAVLHRHKILSVTKITYNTYSKRLRYITATELLIILIGLFLSLSLASMLVAQPLAGWDALAIWFYKAKLFFESESLTVQTFIYDRVRNPDYPPGFPLVVDFLYVLRGDVSEALGKSVVFIYLFGFLQMLKNLLMNYEREVKVLVYVVFGFMIFGEAFRPYLFEVKYLGYVDFIVGLLISASMLFSWMGFKDKVQGYSLAGVYLAVFASLHKYDALASVAISVGLYSYLYLLPTLREKRHSVLLRKFSIIIVLCSPLLAWMIFTKVADFPSYVDQQSKSLSMLFNEAPQRLGRIAYYTARTVIKDTGILVIAPSVFLIVFAMAKNLKKYWVLTSFFLAQLILYTFIYLITPLDLDTHLKTSIDRLAIQICLMLLTAIIAILLGESKKRGIQKNAGA